MNESEAVEKMRELMVTIETMEKFKNIRDKWPKAVLIGLSSIFASVLIYLLVFYIDYLTVNPFLGNILLGNVYYGAGLFAAIAWILGIYLCYKVLNKAYKTVQSTNWEQDLKEGPLGIIKIMSRYNWDRKLLDLRRSKQGFMIVSFSQLAFNFFFFLVVVGLGLGFFISFAFQTQPNWYFLIFFAFVFTLILGDRNLKKLHSRLWSADILIGEIGRFSSDFKQREL